MLIGPHKDPASLLPRETAEPFGTIHDADVPSLIDRARDARVVLSGEGSHSTSQIHRMRAHMTRALLLHAASTRSPSKATGPTLRTSTRASADASAPPAPRPRSRAARRGMWRNREVVAFVERAKQEAP